MTSHPLPTKRAELGRLRPVLEELGDCLTALLDRVDEHAARAIGHLERNTACPAGDDRGRLPHRLGYDETEALANRLLHHDVGKRAGRR